MREVTSDKRTAQQQHTYWEDEAKRLSSEKEALNKVLTLKCAICVVCCLWICMLYCLLFLLKHSCVTCKT